jgi:hypothetical protein
MSETASGRRRAAARLPLPGDTEPAAPLRIMVNKITNLIMDFAQNFGD